MPYQFVGLFVIFVFTNIYPVAGDGNLTTLKPREIKSSIRFSVKIVIVRN